MQDNRHFVERVEGSKRVYREMYGKEPLKVAMSIDTFNLWREKGNNAILLHDCPHTQITCCGLKIEIDNELELNDFIIGVCI